jgi:hypothetical protein
VYGGLSPDIKAIMDRNIGIMLPFFRIKSKEMHHYPRYKEMPGLTYHFYGTDISDAEKATASRLYNANCLNLSTGASSSFFHLSLEQLTAALSPVQ